MSDLPGELREIASAFDLGEYEIEAYLAVLEHGELTASGIADATGVPQPRVYDTARSLADRGLVELRESRPMRVVAVDPDDAFGGLQASLSDLVDDLETRYTTPTRGTEAATLVRSRSSILRYLGEVIESADYELALSLTPRLLEEFESALAAAIDRGVSTELVVTPAAEAPDPDAFDYGRVATAARARRGITTPVLAVADGEYSVYATQRAVRDGTDDYGVIFNRSALGFLLGGFFGTVIWTTADALLIEDGPEPSFPRRYASIRRCIKEIRTLDADLIATVEGRDVLTGEERVLEGRVAATHFTEDEEVATLRLETDDGPVEVGGRVAAYEDIEAHRIDVERAP